MYRISVPGRQIILDKFSTQDAYLFLGFSHKTKIIFDRNLIIQDEFFHFSAIFCISVLIQLNCIEDLQFFINFVDIICICFSIQDANLVQDAY